MKNSSASFMSFQEDPNIASITVIGDDTAGMEAVYHKVFFMPWTLHQQKPCFHAQNNGRQETHGQIR